MSSLFLNLKRQILILGTCLFFLPYKINGDWLVPVIIYRAECCELAVYGVWYVLYTMQEKKGT